MNLINYYQLPSTVNGSCFLSDRRYRIMTPFGLKVVHHFMGHSLKFNHPPPLIFKDAHVKWVKLKHTLHGIRVIINKYKEIGGQMKNKHPLFI